MVANPMMKSRTARSAVGDRSMVMAARVNAAMARGALPQNNTSARVLVARPSAVMIE